MFISKCWMEYFGKKCYYKGFIFCFLGRLYLRETCQIFNSYMVRFILYVVF